MSETMPTPERKLWYSGVNYTADAIFIDQQAEKILLIKRGDCGEWALPGGFVDDGEEPIVTAAREVFEEASLEPTTENPELIYRGIVDDPRNSQAAWIETSAYLFDESSQRTPDFGDDAADAQWFSLGDLPPLYASHEIIVALALDYLAENNLLSQLTTQSGQDS